MRYIKPTYCDQFFCAGETCPAPCPAPVDMTWTRTQGGLCETGLSLACPKAAELILGHANKAVFSDGRDELPDAELSGVGKEHLELMIDARRTVDLLLQDRETGIRPGLVLALTYSGDFEPLITAKNRYAYEELDWGFTEQSSRQFQALVQFTGKWELKRSDMCNILWEYQLLCEKDAVLVNHLGETLKLLQKLSGEEYRIMRDAFDRYIEPREQLFENLLLYYVHRYFLADAERATVEPNVKLMAVSFAVLRAMAARIWRETGELTEEAFITLCWHYARCAEEDPEIHQALRQSFCRTAMYNWDRLQRLLWK